MRPRLTYVVTHPVSAKMFLRGQLRYMRERGYDVTVIAAPGPELEVVAEREGVQTIGVPMSRGVDVPRAMGAVGGLARALRRARPDILNASTPQAAFLSLPIARALGVPLRIYLLRGLRLEGSSGVARSLLGAAERVSAACAHHVVSVSDSLRRVYVEGGYAPAHKLSVIPSNGIDVTRFAERERTRGAAATIRERHGIPAEAPVAGFVGRLVADKGASDLVEAIDRAAREVRGLRLLVVGGDLAGDKLDPRIKERLASSPNVTLVGTVADPSPYYAAMDFLVFPSFREGLPNVPLEAAACELPAIGYRSTGVVDAIADAETGKIVEQRDVAALTAAVVEYARSPTLRAAQGEAARRRVLERFTNERTWEAWADLYDRMRA